MASFSDDFSGTLSAWQIVSGEWSVSSGQLLAGGGNPPDFPTVMLYNSPCDSEDQFVEIDVISVVSHNGFVGGHLCGTAGSRVGYGCMIRPRSDICSINITSDGVSNWIELENKSFYNTYPATIRFEKTGNTLNLYRNGNLELSHTIVGTPISGNRVGLIGHTVNTAVADNFSGGDLAQPAPTLSTPTATATTANSISFSIPVAF